METATKVHFSVEPGFYERHARGLMLEANWRGAIAFLMDTLEGMTLDIAVDVLRGKVALKSDGDGLDTCPQDPEDEHYKRFLETYEWQHAGLWQVDAEFYQPYGVVKRFGRDDEQFAAAEMRIFEDRDYTPSEYRLLRAKFYCERRESDLVVFHPKHGAVLFKRVPGPAFWHQSFRESSDALANYLTRRSLESFRTERPERNPLSGDPKHWRFYAPAMRLLQLREPRWDEDVLSDSVLETLETLIALQDKIRDAKWAEEARKAGRDDEDFDELEEDERNEDDGERLSVNQLESRFETAMLRAQIREQARTNGGFLPLTIKNEFGEGESVVDVPALPLLWWASRNIPGFKHEDLAHWPTVCESGMKMMGDSPMHTDWWIGAGYEPEGAYYDDHPLNKAAWNFSFTFNRTHKCDFVKLAGKGRVLGRVVFPKPNEGVEAGSIAVVPSAGVAYDMAMRTACKGGRGAVIAGVGGKLAHLVTVAREMEARIVVVDDAMNVFKEGEFVTLDLDKGTLERHKTLLRRYSVGQDDE
jgi:phosphohistidine swiveling domain-containing protein